MPAPLIAPLIGAGASLLGTGINVASTGNMNKKNRAHQEYMYDKQKTDNIDFWNQQNSYNSPEQQMARLQKAGLNPHLVYGNGSAVNTAGDISTPHAQPYKGEAPQVDIPQVLDSFFNIQSQQQVIANQKKQADLLDAQISLANANTADKLFQNKYNQDTQHIRRNYDANRSNKMHYEYQSEMKKYDLMNLLQDIQVQKAKAELSGLNLQNTLRHQESKNKDLQYKSDKAIYDSSMKGMTLQDWLKLGLGASSQFLPGRRR